MAQTNNIHVDSAEKHQLKCTSLVILLHCNKYATIATQYTEIILIKFYIFYWQECIPDNDLNQVKT